MIVQFLATSFALTATADGDSVDCSCQCEDRYAHNGTFDAGVGQKQ